MKKRILLLDTGKEWGGGTNSMFELLKRIDCQRFDITALFYCNYRKGEHSDLRSELAAIGIPLELLRQPRQPLWAKLAKELVRGFLRPFPSLRQRALHSVERQWRIVPAADAIVRRLRAGKFDLLYMNNQPSSNLEGYLAGEATGIPVIQHCRSNAVLSRAECDVVNRVAQSIICVSEGLRDSLVGQGVSPKLCTVVHNAIDVMQPVPEPVILPGVSADAVVIGAVGSLLARKANHHIIRALALLKSQGVSHIHLVLLGDGPERSRLESLARELGIGACITFAGFQPNALAWESAMDVVVLASEGEGFPRVILEAMFLAKPVIASDVTGTRELVVHGVSGLLFAFGDIEELAEHIRTLVENAGLRRQMGNAGRVHVVQHHSIECYITGVEAVLDSRGSDAY
jgi:glycosyltransferase involved in cell wall biosynthesis